MHPLRCISPFRVLGALLTWFILSPSAFAATSTAPLVVSATVLSVCGVSATPLAFGTYSSTATSPTDATSTITSICSSGVSYTITLDAGAATGATVAARQMTSGANTLNYGIYTNSARTTIWGDGTLSTSTVTGTSALIPQTHTAYGRIPAGQQSAAGVYGDTVTVTISY